MIALTDVKDADRNLKHAGPHAGAAGPAPRVPENRD